MLRSSALPSPYSAPFRRWLRRTVDLVEGLGFWTAVVLPFLYLPLLAVGPSRPLLLVGAVGLNAVALVVGHGYRSAEARPSGASA